MKSQVSPVAAVVIILVVIGIVAFAWTRFNDGAGSREGEKPPGMPAEAAEKFKELGNMSGPGKGSFPGGTTAPPSVNAPRGAPPPGGMGGMTAPNTGG